MKLGISQLQTIIFSNTRKGYCRTANSSILQIFINIESRQQAGYLFFSTYYRSVRVQIRKPPYTEWYVQLCDRTESELIAHFLLDL